MIVGTLWQTLYIDQTFNFGQVVSQMVFHI